MSRGAARSAVVVGGGVGGLATGLALQRQGWRVRVRERSGALERGGAGLVLWPNALRCLRSLGVHDEVRARATVLRESQVLRASGRRLARIALAGGGEEGALAVVRADLVEALAGALDPGVLELDAEVADLDDLEADLVVGADGVRSTVRGSLFPSVVPVHRGYTAWRALLPRDDTEPAGAPAVTETWGRGLRFGVVPVGVSSTYVYATAPARRDGDVRDDLAWLRRTFDGWHAPIPALLDRVDPARLLRHDVHDLPPGSTPLHRGRHALVGDAAHAMEPNLGQGACLAIEDAVVLAHSLRGGGPVETCLAAYAAARAPRVTSLARRSRQVGRVGQLAHPLGTSLRDAAMLVTPDWCAQLGSRDAADWHPPVADLSDAQVRA